MAAKKDPKKNVSKPTGASSSRTSSLAKKAGEDARGRATKYGQLTGKPTTVSSSMGSTTRNLLGQKSEYSRLTTAETQIKSARGNLYNVSEQKIQKDAARDSKPRIYVSPVTRPKMAPAKAAPKKKK